MYRFIDFLILWLENSRNANLKLSRISIIEKLNRSINKIQIL